MKEKFGTVKIKKRPCQDVKRQVIEPMFSPCEKERREHYDWRFTKVFDLEEAIRRHDFGGTPIYGICVGIILLSLEIEGFDQFKFSFVHLLKTHLEERW